MRKPPDLLGDVCTQGRHAGQTVRNPAAHAEATALNATYLQINVVLRVLQNVVKDPVGHGLMLPAQNAANNRAWYCINITGSIHMRAG